MIRHILGQYCVNLLYSLKLTEADRTMRRDDSLPGIHQAASSLSTRCHLALDISPRNQRSCRWHHLQSWQRPLHCFSWETYGYVLFLSFCVWSMRIGTVRGLCTWRFLFDHYKPRLHSPGPHLTLACCLPSLLGSYGGGQRRQHDGEIL